MKAVIYARYSSENQREESIEGQIRECTAFAEKNGITILKHYIAIKIVNDDSVIKDIVSMLMDLQERENIDLPLYEQQLWDVERNIENLLSAIQQGILTKSTKARLEELEAAKEDLEVRIANERIAKPKMTEDHLLHFLLKFRISEILKTVDITHFFKKSYKNTRTK